MNTSSLVRGGTTTAVAAAVITTIGMTIVVMTMGSRSLADLATGVWNCNATLSAELNLRDTHQPADALDESFHELFTEPPMGVNVFPHALDDPEQATPFHYPAYHGTISVWPDGRFEATGLTRDAITGSWTVDGGLVVARNDDPGNHYAGIVEEGDSDARLLSFRDYGSPRMFDSRIDWQDRAVTFTFNSNREGWNVTCAKTSDTPRTLAVGQ